jgi:hypothetical protein
VGCRDQEKETFFETAVTKSLDARTCFWMDYFRERGSSKLLRDLMGIQDVVRCAVLLPTASHFRYQTVTKEIIMKLDSKSGATLAAAAATLFLAGVTVSTVSTTAQAAAGKCMGANACKGQSACKSASNACKGLNSCKNQGFSQMSEKQCTGAGGKYVKS